MNGARILDPFDNTRGMHRLWEDFVTGRRDRLEQLRPVIRDSWLRCRTYNLDPAISAAPSVMPVREAEESREANPLYRAASPVIRLLLEALHGEHCVTTLLDRDLRQLDISGHPKVVQASERINGVVGSQWREDQMGTEGSLCVLTGSPVQVALYEHYCEAAQDWVTTAAPIHDPVSGEPIGLLGLHGHNQSFVHPRALDMVVRAARLIEQQLREAEHDARLALIERFHRDQARHHDDGLLCLDRNGTVLFASSRAAELLRAEHDVAGTHFIELCPPGVASKLEGHTGSEQRFDLTPRGGGFLHATLLPVRHEEQIAGSIVVLSAPRPARVRSPAAGAWRASYTFRDVVGTHPLLQACVEEARHAADSDLPVLLVGESGTGKELIAHAIHSGGRRRNGPFVPINCGALNEELLGAELFGYAEGAFTGAVRGGRPGKLQLADGGTLVLDEVEEMSPRTQVHLLRVLEEGRVIGVGASKPLPVDARIIAATNVELGPRVENGTFRRDLYYRLEVLTIRVPPLRERQSDIPLLVEHLLARAPRRAVISTQAMDRLVAFDWPGNVRQLGNVLFRAAELSSTGRITVGDLPRELRAHGASAQGQTPCAHAPFPHDAEHSDEALAIRAALERADGNLSRAAAELGIHRVTLYRKMLRCNLRVVRSCN